MARSVLCHAGLLLCVMAQRSQIETYAEKNRPRAARTGFSQRTAAVHPVNPSPAKIDERDEVLIIRKSPRLLDPTLHHAPFAVD